MRVPPKLTDLVPVQTLERLRSLFKAVTGVPIVFTDGQGMAITKVDDPLCYCATLVRVESEGMLCLRRAKWDTPEPEVERAIKGESAGGKPIHHRCLGGFQDTAVPIVVEGQTLGFAVFARSLPEPPDPARFRQLALAGGMSPETGEEVAEHSLVMSSGKIAQIGDFLQVITGLVASAAYDSLRAQQVLELEGLRDDLIHMIVHDLRTPLTSIIGSLHTIVETKYDPDIINEFVPLALGNSDTLLGMVNTLLDINKMESGDMEMEITPVDFSRLAAEAVSQVKGLAFERRQELSVDIDPNCPVIQADEDKLRRVVVNLLGNAVKFTQDGGHVSLSAACDGDGLTFSVSDDGPGIPQQYHEKIFEKFGHVEAQRQGAKPSTGLGLTFCKMVAEAHGGRIWLTSEPGQGSTFSLFIPLKAKAISRTPKAKRNDEGTRRL